MDAATRRIEINQMTLGTGVIFFGIWSLARAFLTFFMVDDDEITQMNDSTIKTTVYVILMIFAFVLTFLQLYVGVSARSEGLGRQKPIAYRVIISLIILSYFLSILLEIVGIFVVDSSYYISLFVSIVIDATLFVCLIEMLINSVQLKKIRNKAITVDNGGVR